MTHPSPNLVVAPFEVEMLLERGATILDVREQFVRRSGFICGVTHIPQLQLPPTTLSTWRAIGNACRTGRCCAIAARRLRVDGADARDLAGGRRTWRKAALPIRSGDLIREVR